MFDSVVTIASAVGELAILLFMIRGKVWTSFPSFLIYTVWTIVSDLSDVIVGHSTSYETYFRFGMVESSIDFILQFIVLIELAWAVLRPMRSSLPKGTPIALGLLIVVAGALIWPLAAKTVPVNIGPESQFFFHLEETFAILRIAAFVVMAGFSQLLAIGWRDRELQIATGFGFYSIISLIASVLRSHIGNGPDSHWLDQAESLSYLGTLTYWVFSFSTKEQERKEFSPQMQQLLLQMGGGARANRVSLTQIPSDRSRKKD